MQILSSIRESIWKKNFKENTTEHVKWGRVVIHISARNNRVTGRDLPRKGYPPTIPAPMSPYNVFPMSRKRCVYTKYSMYIYIYIIYRINVSYLYIYIYIWVIYNISLTWIKAILGWFPLLTMIIVRSQCGRSEVVIIYPYIYIYIYYL